MVVIRATITKAIDLPSSEQITLSWKVPHGKGKTQAITPLALSADKFSATINEQIEWKPIIKPDKNGVKAESLQITLKSKVDKSGDFAHPSRNTRAKLA